jgi:hypothetical protein
MLRSSPLATACIATVAAIAKHACESVQARFLSANFSGMRNQIPCAPFARAKLAKSEREASG